MLVCSCTRVSAEVIRSVIADGASTPDEIAARCRAGSRCGGCQPFLRDLLEAHGIEAHGIEVREPVAVGLPSLAS
jgi:bacterioferritin-associated ferredoxin